MVLDLLERISWRHVFVGLQVGQGRTVGIDCVLGGRLEAVIAHKAAALIGCDVVAVVACRACSSSLGVGFGVYCCFCGRIHFRDSAHSSIYMSIPIYLIVQEPTVFCSHSNDDVQLHSGYGGHSSYDEDNCSVQRRSIARPRNGVGSLGTHLQEADGTETKSTPSKANNQLSQGI